MMSSGDPETRKRILMETRLLMEKQRGKDVRIEDIARAAGVSRQAVYMHFGSRAGLLVATARYLDETLELPNRIQGILNAEHATQALDDLVVFWANYIPEIYGLAKALMTVRETDEAAASAWDDRMAAFYGKCESVVGGLQLEGLLSTEWTSDTAADFLWASLSIVNWENLTIERGWSNEQYILHMQTAMKKALVTMS